MAFTGVDMQAPNCTSQTVSFKGPRTVAGKRQSRRNAIKDGLFSRHLLLNGEGPIFERIHRGLREYWQPEDMMRDLLVRDLAMVFLRARRKSLAESGMIARSPAFVGLDGLNSDLPRPASLRAALNDGSTPLSAKVVLLQRAVEKLDDLSKSIAKGEFDFEKTQIILFEIYGAFDPRHDQRFCGKLFVLTRVGITCNAGNSETMSKITELAQDLIDMEIRRLSELVKDVESNDAVCNSLASLVLPPADLERILRCGNHLGREMERIVNLLLKLQCAHRSHPLPSTPKVEVG
jgi:hypothetical protein